jgi:hypothetical protein
LQGCTAVPRRDPLPPLPLAGAENLRRRARVRGPLCSFNSFVSFPLLSLWWGAIPYFLRFIRFFRRGRGSARGVGKGVAFSRKFGSPGIEGAAGPSFSVRDGQGGGRLAHAPHDAPGLLDHGRLPRVCARACARACAREQLDPPPFQPTPTKRERETPSARGQLTEGERAPPLVAMTSAVVAPRWWRRQPIVMLKSPGCGASAVIRDTSSYFLHFKPSNSAQLDVRY